MDRPNGDRRGSTAVANALDALARRPREATSRDLRVLELEHTVRALAAENQRLRRELRALELKLDPDARGMEAASPRAVDAHRSAPDRI
jgi:hypothetical protein